MILPSRDQRERFFREPPMALRDTEGNETGNGMSCVLPHSFRDGSIAARIVGRPFQAADPLSSGLAGWKAGCGQDCLAGLPAPQLLQNSHRRENYATSRSQSTSLDVSFRGAMRAQCVTELPELCT